MAKETYYFPHDCNAIQDPRMMQVLSECGLSGIAMYWIIIEILHQQEDGKITEEAYKNYIRFYASFETSVEQVLNKIEQSLTKSGLLLNTGGMVYSRRVLNNKKKRHEISEKRSKAGSVSAAKRAKRTSVKQVPTSVEQNPTKERKGKEKSKGAATLQTRILNFKTEVFAHGDYPPEMLNAFCNYWLELNPTKTKCRFELEKTFEISRRLVTWKRNDGSFTKQVAKPEPAIDYDL